jgi:hypothetical protein
MAHQDAPDQNTGKSKTQGERWRSESTTIRNADRDEHPERLYEGEQTDNAGGITNRPLSEEIDNQEGLPARGTTRDPTRDPDATELQGDYTEKER